jgi:hypothetical protein
MFEVSSFLRLLDMRVKKIYNIRLMNHGEHRTVSVGSCVRKEATEKG